MLRRFSLLLLLLAMSITFSNVLLANDDKQEEKKVDENAVVAPQSPQQAKELFIASFGLEKEQNFEKATAGYEAVLGFYQKQEGTEYDAYIMYTLQNLAVLYANKGETDKATRLLGEALRYAEKLGDCGKMSNYHHKLGIIYDYKCKIKQEQMAQKNNITPDGNIVIGEVPILKKKSFSGFTAIQGGSKFIPESVHTSGTENPFERTLEHYTKLVNLKLKGDFNEEQLLVPDSVRFIVEVNKKGYFPIYPTVEMLAEKEYSEINEKMIAIPRKVEPKIFEDFYGEGAVTPDDINLTLLENGKEKGKPRRINDSETYKPGNYILTIRKAGYEDIREPITIHPNEGAYQLQRRLLSKYRDLESQIRGDFVLDGKDIIDAPDEFTLNGQGVNIGSKVKPGEYQLVIKEEGYEPIIKNIVVPPSDTSFRLYEHMKTLPRQVYFKITGDYELEKELTPDEIAFNNRFVKVTGETVRPDTYRVVIRKRGYEPVSERITIFPSSQPYVLEQGLRSLPRRVQTNIMASFPKMRISPDKCTLNGKDIKTQENFKPGSYELKVERSGYIPITKIIEISPSDEPYTIVDVLNPKDVELKMQITYDVEPEDTTLTYNCKMKDEVLGLFSDVKDGSKIKPESYLYEIARAGYEIATDRILIMPREDAYVLQQKLVARDRNVITDIVDEKGQALEPDEITLDNKPIGKDFKVKPGVHELVILKEGYLPVRKPIQILASEKDFILSQVLISKTRLVTFEFRDSYTKELVTPEQISIGRENPKNPKTVLTMKPGSYPLRVVKTGYATINKSVDIPVGTGSHIVQELMVATVREVTIQLTGDFKVGEELEADTLTLNEIPMGRQGKVRPGVYELVIQKKGYFPIYKRLNITPGQEPFQIVEEMKSKPRKLVLTIMSSYTNAKMVPTSIVVGTQDVKDGQEIKPAEYQFAIKEKGYRTISSGLIIEPSEDPYNLDATMEALPRKIQYTFISDFDNKEVMPDVITLDNEIMEQGATHLPGTYTVSVEKQGYQEKKFDIVVPPSDEVYILKDVLETIAREIELDITGDYPEGERVDPEIVALDGKDAREHLFKPRKYELEIQHPGYFPLRKDVIILPGNEPFLIQEVLVTKPRKLNLNIAYDVPPPTNLAPYKVTMAPLDKPNNAKEVKTGDIIKPNSYLLKIEKQAYSTIEIKQNVWPDERPFSIDQMLRAKQVVIHINITHNVQPPSNLPPYQVSLISKKNNVLTLVTHGKRIVPGSYDLKISQPGYNYGTNRTIDISPSEEPYLISENLLANKRQISFEMVDPDTGLLVESLEVINVSTGQKATFKDTYEPGQSVSFKIKFEKYETQEVSAVVIPGEGPYVLPIPMTKLKPLEFTLRKQKVVQDGIEYPFSFSVDSKELEEHLIKIEQGMGRFYYTVMVPPKSNNFRVYGGYTFLQVAMDRFRPGMSIGRLESISIPKLIGHLDRITKKDERGRRAALEVMETMLKSFRNRKMLKSSHPNERAQLISFLESWKLDTQTDRIRLQVVTDAVNKIE